MIMGLKNMRHSSLFFSFLHNTFIYNIMPYDKMDFEQGIPAGSMFILQILLFFK